MNELLIIIFIVAYAAIAFEHPIKVNKSASALIGGRIVVDDLRLLTGHVVEAVKRVAFIY